MKLVFVIVNLHYLLLSADSFVSELQITLNWYKNFNIVRYLDSKYYIVVHIASSKMYYCYIFQYTI